MVERTGNNVGGAVSGSSPGQSDYFYLNSQYGSLNPLFDSFVRDTPGADIGMTDNFLEHAKRVIERDLQSKIIENTGRFLGVVLRIETDESQLTPSEKNWITRVQKNNCSQQTPLMALRVRVPELHAHLPIPKTLPKTSFSSFTSVQGLIGQVSEQQGVGLSDESIINMYPVFSSTDTQVSLFTPQVGTLVWVSFVDKTTQTGGIYMGPLDYEKATVNSQRLNGSGMQAFMEGGVGNLGTSNIGGNFSYTGVTELPPGTPASVGYVRDRIQSFKTYRGNNVADDPIRLEAAYYIFDRMTLALGWSAAWAAAAVVQAGGESAMNPAAIENKHAGYPKYGPGFGLHQITNTGGMGAPVSKSYIVNACSKLPPEIKSKIGFVEGATILPDLDANGNLVARDVSYLADRYAGDFALANADPPPPLRTGKSVAGYYDCTDAKVSMDRWVLGVLKYFSDSAYSSSLTAAQCFDKLHWSFLGAGSNKVYIDRANNGDAGALEKLIRFSAGNAKRQRNGYKWLGDEGWGPIGPYADERNPIVLPKGKKLNVPVQVPVVSNTNSPALIQDTGNTYSSKGGFILSPRTTIAGINSKTVNIDGQLVDVQSKVLSRGVYRVQTTVKIIPSQHVKIKPEDWSSKKSLSSLRTNKVRVYSYADLGEYTDNIVNVPSVMGRQKQKLHILAAKRLEALNSSWLNHIKNLKEKPQGSAFLQQKKISGLFRISSGYTKHKFRDDYEYYVAKMKQKYGSLEAGEKIEPFHSPKETGLVFDIGNNGFLKKFTSVSQNNINYCIDLYSWNWLSENAYLFGIYPDGTRPWRWEVQIPRANWFSGKDFIVEKNTVVSNKYRGQYAYYVIEESDKSGNRTSDEKFDTSIFF